MPEHIKRIAITGGAGSGKTTLATRIASETGMPLHDLDGLTLNRSAGVPDPTAAALIGTLAQEAVSLAAGDEWISDGSYVWAAALFERAELIIALDVPWRVASWRIIKRHLEAEIARNNRFPGWRKLGGFWLFSRRFYAGTNPDGPNVLRIAPDTRLPGRAPQAIRTQAHGLPDARRCPRIADRPRTRRCCRVGL